MLSEAERRQGLQATLQAVQELLTRQTLVAGLVARQASPRQELVQSLVHRQHAAELASRLNRLHPADTAFVLESLPHAQRTGAWQLLDHARHGAVLLELSGAVRKSLVSLLDDDDLLTVATQMAPEEFAGLAQDLPPERVQQILARLTLAERTEVRSALAFPAGTAGSAMETDVVTLRAEGTLDEALRRVRRRRSWPREVTRIVVVDEGNILRGLLPLDRLLVGDGDRAVADVMEPDPVYFFTGDRMEDVAQAFERYQLVMAPVVNLHRQVVGWVHVDAVLGRVAQDSFRQSLSQVGLREDEDLFAPAVASGRQRWAWLGLNLITALVASRVVGAFEGSITQLAALAALMPVVASIGGNTGNQTVALVIRGLALAQIHDGNVWFVLRRELSIALFNGGVWGAGMGAVTLALYGSWSLAAVMAVAMLLNMLLASLVGVLSPWLLTRWKRDPAMGSSILLTATTDSMGFLIFLGLATALVI